MALWIPLFYWVAIIWPASCLGLVSPYVAFYMFYIVVSIDGHYVFQYALPLVAFWM